jgi:site-specific DNA recombinase
VGVHLAAERGDVIAFQQIIPGRATAMSPKKIARPLDIYVRVNDVRGRAGKGFISPKDQEDRCRAAIASRGLEVGQVFKVLDVSGGSMERPELRKVRERIEAGVSGGIVVARIDRFGRTVARALDAIEEIDKAGGVVITAEGDFDTSTAVGELLLGMMLQLAQFELRRVRENWQSAKRNAVARGLHISRHVPPGYERDSSRRLVPHPKHSKTVAKAFQLAAQGVMPARIAEHLTEQGLPSGDNKNTVWKSSRIKRLLANRVYLGEARANDEIVNAEAHEPLVDDTTFLLAQRKPVATPISPTSSYLLSGLVRCASCRHSMRPQKASKHAVAVYRCATETASGRCPHPSSISMKRLDDIVLESFVGHALLEPAQPRVEQDAAVAQTLVAEAQRDLDEVKALEGDLRPAVYAQALNGALDRIEEAQQALVRGQAWDERDAALLANAGLPLFDRSKPFDTVGLEKIRAALARDIRAVFVRPAASRSKSVPIADRVYILWNDDDEEIELPKRGEAFVPHPYTWPEGQAKEVARRRV